MKVSEILEKYVAGLNAQDADAIAELYAEDSSFVDGGARLQDFDDVVADGREGIRAAFKGVFEQFKVKATIIKLNPNSMEYDVELAGIVIPCIGAATCDEEGKIKEYIVRPR